VKIKIEIDEATLKAMVLRKLQYDLGDAGKNVKLEDIDIKVKSKQNYRAEWEPAAFRASIEVETKHRGT
jgi:hypothetical protein